MLVCGGREWDDLGVLLKRLEALPEGTVVIHGACRGADRMGGAVAKTLDFEVEEYPADWSRYDYLAGVIRNQQMLDEGKPDLVLAFHADIERSKGTADMVRRARKAGLPVEVVSGPVTPEA